MPTSPLRRVLFYSILWGMSVSVTLGLVGWSEWPRSGVQLAVGLLAAWLTYRRRLRYFRVWRRCRFLLDKPPVLNEDGNVYVPVLMPGETVAYEHAWDGEIMAVRVTRPDGSVRVASRWR